LAFKILVINQCACGALIDSTQKSFNHVDAAKGFQRTKSFGGISKGEALGKARALTSGQHARGTGATQRQDDLTPPGEIMCWVFSSAA
jgi:hypothetical protein